MMMGRKGMQWTFHPFTVKDFKCPIWFSIISTFYKAEIQYSTLVKMLNIFLISDADFAVQFIAKVGSILAKMPMGN